MLELIIMICIGLLLVRWLRPKPGELAACWPPTTTIHVHGPVLVVHREGEGVNSTAARGDQLNKTTRGSHVH